jgi:RNA polymerase sigma-70 factor (sigma-E family)
VAEPVGFDAFVLARRRSLLRTAWLLTGDWYAAEDLVQNALMRCYPKWRRISKGDPDAYVRRAVFNAHLSGWRRRWRGERPTAIVPDWTSATDEYAELDRRHDVAAALAELPRRQRAVVILRFYEDMTERQVAAALGCSVGTVKSQLARALVTLRANGVPLMTDVTEAARD